jgi:hypothetical protein
MRRLRRWHARSTRMLETSLCFVVKVFEFEDLENVILVGRTDLRWG